MRAMIVHRYLVCPLVIAALCCGCVGTDVCKDMRDTSFTFSVLSTRNVTGHWIFTVEADSADPRKPWQVERPREMGIEMGHSSRFCNEMDTTHLSAKATTSYPTSVPYSGYECFTGLGYYKLHTEALAWQEAQEKCVKERAYLLVINSHQEATVVTNYFARKLPIHNASYDHIAFVGFNDMDVEGNFVTVLGEPLNQTGYTEWYTGKPDGAEQDNCGGVNKDAKYFDIDCSHKLMFICEHQG